MINNIEGNLTPLGTTKHNKPNNDGGLSRRYIMLEVEKTLKNLKTDRLDIYMIHHMDPDTPMEETLRAFEDLKRQGKIIYAGISNAAAWEIALSLGISYKEWWKNIWKLVLELFVLMLIIFTILALI